MGRRPKSADASCPSKLGRSVARDGLMAALEPILLDAEQAGVSFVIIEKIRALIAARRLSAPLQGVPQIRNGLAQLRWSLRVHGPNDDERTRRRNGRLLLECDRALWQFVTPKPINRGRPALTGREDVLKLIAAQLSARPGGRTKYIADAQALRVSSDTAIRNLARDRQRLARLLRKTQKP